jgi:hypothetical protein
MFPLASRGYILEVEVTKMTALIMIIGGVAGGVVGWLFDRKRNKQAEANPQPEEACETRA